MMMCGYLYYHVILIDNNKTKVKFKFSKKIKL